LVLTSPVFHKEENILRKNFLNHNFDTMLKIIIVNDVWIGNNYMINNRIKIEDGEIIRMVSFVTKNIGPHEIWAGNPTKSIQSF